MNVPVTKKGKFVISLDFELMWGVRDKRTIDSYGMNIIGVRQAIPAMLSSFSKHNVKATFSTVGFLFAENKTELKRFLPDVKPLYTDSHLSPYSDIEHIGESEDDDPYHFGYSLFQQIEQHKVHEISTHTFCHYYCLEPGQTALSFEEDLKSAQKIAGSKGLKLRSLVFPRNQFNKEYLTVCKEAGIESYRGNPQSWLYSGRGKNDESPLRRAFRFFDAYINLTGYHCHSLHELKEPVLINIPASRFLRPYSKKLALLEGLRLHRIKKAMLYAARNKKLFHLWWHPHNFGININENINFLERILAYYSFLNKQYGFESITMSGLADEINGQNE
jgi:peptidoglycan/xylan/chitin deacetylase (PgdA/CDA1 family)